jgi:hypothetical protein
MQPSNETEAEALQRRQVEALEAIANALEKLASVVHPINGGGLIRTDVNDR